MAEISITQTDVENVFGAQFVAQWSSFDQGATTPTADAARIALACANGKAWFNGAIGTGPYAVPVSSSDPATDAPDVIDAMATYAGWWLFRSRGINYAKDTLKWMNEHYKRIRFFASDVRFGRYPLASCALNTNRRQTPFSAGR